MPELSGVDRRPNWQAGVPTMQERDGAEPAVSRCDSWWRVQQLRDLDWTHQLRSLPEVRRAVLLIFRPETIELIFRSASRRLSSPRELPNSLFCAVYSRQIPSPDGNTASWLGSSPVVLHSRPESSADGRFIRPELGEVRKPWSITCRAVRSVTGTPDTRSTTAGASRAIRGRKR